MNETQFRKLLKEYLSYITKGKWWAEVQHIAGNYTTEKGKPDFSGLYEGYYVGIEAKVGKNNLSEDQMIFKAQIENCGGYYEVVYPHDYEKVIYELIQKIEKRKDKKNGTGNRIKRA